jgi:hypothetical protein
MIRPFQARELLARVNVHMQLGLLRIELEKRGEFRVVLASPSSLWRSNVVFVPPVQERTCALIDSETRNRALADKFSTLSTVSPVGIVQAGKQWFARDFFDARAKRLLVSGVSHRRPWQHHLREPTLVRPPSS